MTPPRRGIYLEYRFDATPTDQRGAALANPLIDLLRTLRDSGSISAAARALGSSYRHTWGALKHWELVLGAPLVVWAKGQPALLTPLAERLLWAETRARTRLAPHIEALRSELERVLSLAFDAAHEALTVYASHDLALPLLRDYADAHGLHIDLRFAGSSDALQALAQGRCDVAGFHVPALSDGKQAGFTRALKHLLKPGRHKLIASHRRRQGLIVAQGNPHALHGVADLARSGLRFVNRQPGSGTRLLSEHLLAQAGIAFDAIAGFHGPCEDTHVAVAAAVASGVADAGIGIEAAAAQFSLAFVPLIEEDYYLLCRKEALERAAVQRLRELLAGQAWRAALASLPGCTPHVGAGSVLALTQALPWWRYRTPRR
ncbi:MAG: substrate-binding domain-containing protein [Burkholderiaceae bacterium]|nr:substrate-binding domain-containing protein [Burkholderiaceae bacterium]